MSTVSVNAVADWFIFRSGCVGDPITNLKLQKLVYYAQAWRLALEGKPLIKEEFQAWAHGPVCDPLYQRFKQFGWRPVTEVIEEPELAGDIRQHLEEVMQSYGGHSAYDLERLTHSEPPWKDARGALPVDARSSATISTKAMRDYYRSLIPSGKG